MPKTKKRCSTCLYENDAKLEIKHQCRSFPLDYLDKFLEKKPSSYEMHQALMGLLLFKVEYVALETHVQLVTKLLDFIAQSGTDVQLFLDAGVHILTKNHAKVWSTFGDVYLLLLERGANIDLALRGFFDAKCDCTDCKRYISELIRHGANYLEDLQYLGSKEYEDKKEEKKKSVSERFNKIMDERNKQGVASIVEDYVSPMDYIECYNKHHPDRLMKQLDAHRRRLFESECSNKQSDAWDEYQAMKKQLEDNEAYFKDKSELSI